MGNISSISFKKNMSDDAFTEALKEVCYERFNGLVEVRLTYFEGELCSWVVEPKEGLLAENEESWRYEWEVYREGKRKFGGKHPCSDWGSWMMGRVQNELAYRYNGRISDEGVSGTWEGDPTKYRTYREYMESMNSFLFKNHKESFNQIFEIAPEILREM